MSRHMKVKDKQVIKISTLEMNGKTFISNKEKAEILADSFFKNSSNENFTKNFQIHKINFENNNETEFLDDSRAKERNNVFNVPFTKSELISALSTSKNNKSPGKDNIVYE